MKHRSDRAMIRDDIVQTMQVLAEVWEGTENADQILEDTARTIGHRVFGLQGDELTGFAVHCVGKLILRADEAAE